MPEKSRYCQNIKSEYQKINKTVGICCAFDPCSNYNKYSEEDIENMELLRNILIDNGNCDEVICNNREKNNCRCEKEHDKYYTPTNIYRFHNQNFVDNYLGCSNINVTYINKTLAERKAKIERILERYNNKCNKCRRCR
jgi:hypothetical protein